LNLERGLEKRLKARMEQASESGLLERTRPLFVCGCARSGTTAFGDYLNQHEEVLLCQERYKERQKQVAWEDFSFQRIMDFRPQETKRPPLGQTREAPRSQRPGEAALARRQGTVLREVHGPAGREESGGALHGLVSSARRGR